MRTNKPFHKKEKKGLAVEVRYPPNPTEEQKHKSFTNAMRKFKKMVMQDGILQEYRENQAYQKPSEKRSKAKAMARKRWLKKEAEIRAEA